MDFRKIPSGWMPDPPDPRDIQFTDVIKLRVARLPSIVDLRGSFRGVNYQDYVGSCTAQSASDGMEYVDFVENRPRIDFSRLFLYYNSRTNKSSDAGAYLRDTFKSLNREGICPEALWPHNVSNWAEKPSQNCYDDALHNKAIEYLSVVQGQQVRQVLAEGFPISFGTNLYETFYNIDRGGMVPMPNLNEPITGRHAMLLVGYKANDGLYIVRNSWSDRWGAYGYCYMPYGYIDNANLSRNFWVVKKKSQGSPTPRPPTCCGIGQQTANRVRSVLGMELKVPAKVKGSSKSRR